MGEAYDRLADWADGLEKFKHLRLAVQASPEMPELAAARSWARKMVSWMFPVFVKFGATKEICERIRRYCSGDAPGPNVEDVDNDFAWAVVVSDMLNHLCIAG